MPARRGAASARSTKLPQVIRMCMYFEIPLVFLILLDLVFEPDLDLNSTKKALCTCMKIKRLLSLFYAANACLRRLLQVPSHIMLSVHAISSHA